MGTGDDSDDADSFLRQLAAAPPANPPPRILTAMLIQLGDAASRQDQIGSVRALVEPQEGRLEQRGDGRICVLWTHPARAAGAALELRDALPDTRIALATATVDAREAKGSERVVERALAILAAGAERVCIDEETAKAVENEFEIETSEDGFVLVEPMASGTPAVVNRVIGNYRIVRLLGTGGMGVVYLAEHVSLGRKAVIKFVQDRLTKDTTYTQRFFIEAKTAASIRHPGIVDVFDYGKDEQGRGYIVMELLEGESLRTRLRREKPLKTELAVALGAQMANALAAAHAAGVIHRDLKPDNLFLVPDNDSPYRVRAKVLDFGLAKVTADPSPGVTQSGNFVGTPLYMSPEQCRAKAEIDHRTDIYSLGCILYEMATGRPPFLDKTVGDLIIAHNTLPPTPPSEVVPTLTPALERAILKALAKHPDDRFASAEAFAATLSALLPGGSHVAAEATALARPRGVSAPPPISAAAPASVAAAKTESVERSAPRKWFVIGPVVAAVLALVVGGVFALRRGSEQLSVAQRITKAARVGAGKPTIAIVDLSSTTGKPEVAWLSTAITEVVTSDLQGASSSDRPDQRSLHVMSADEVARMKAELNVGSQAEWSAEKLASVRSDLGADYVIAGSYVAVGNGQVQVNAHLYDTLTGSELTRLQETGQESDLIGLGARLSASVERALGIEINDEAPPPVTALPSNATAARLYSEGLGKARQLDLIDARDLFTKAAAEQPDDPLIHAALAGVWHELGYQSQTRSEAKLAYDYSKALPRENQLAIEAQYREANAQWEQAITSYKTLFEFFPSRLEYGLELAAVQTHSGDAKSAYATLATLRKLPRPLGSDPRIELAEAHAAEEADDIERMREHAEKAALIAGKRGAKLLRAKALVKEGWALWTLGRDNDADPVYAEAKQLFSDLGDRSGLARTLNNIALAQHRRHQDTNATRTFADALKLAQEIGDTETQAWVLHNWGYVLADAGDLEKALDLDKKKLELGGERGDLPSSQAAAHVNISEILRWRGDLQGAQEHCNAAEDLLRGLDARRFAAYAALYCGELLHVEDDLAGAKKRFAQAISWASDVMTPAESADMRIAMARAKLDDNDLVGAEELARGASADLAAAKEDSQRVCATAVLASVLAANAQYPAAQKEIEATAALPEQGVSFACRLEAEIAAARVAAKVDPTQRDVSLAKLEATRARAAAATFVQSELAARLAIGELKGAAGREGLRKLAKDADALGFKLVARKARALMH